LQHGFIIDLPEPDVKQKMKPKMNRKAVIIKRYGNRRLYDTRNSRYINQDEVAQMVREGQEVQVVDAATGEDLTRLVLTQIIVQNAKESDSAFPLDILRQMVVACGKVTEGTTLKYMKAVADMYQNAYQAMAPQINPFKFIGVPAKPFSPAFTMPSSSIEEEGSDEPSRGKDEGGEIGDLKQRIEELESMVSVLGTSKRVGKRKTKAGKKRSAR
jgi:polyhydroxyalkanoate synthesis repressor PhaR